MKCGRWSREGSRGGGVGRGKKSGWLTRDGELLRDRFYSFTALKPFKIAIKPQDLNFLKLLPELIKVSALKNCKMAKDRERKEEEEEEAIETTDD